MNIRPLHDRVLVRRKEEEETSQGGILIPNAAKEESNQGEVIAVGEGKLLKNGDVRKVSVKVGDTVIFGKYAGSNTIKHNGEKLIILNESDLMAVVE